MGTKFEFQARTQYNDLKGSIKIDFPGAFHDLDEYVRSLGIDLEKYDPQGIEIYRGESQPLEEVTVTIIAVDRLIRDRYADENDGRLPIVKIANADSFVNFMSRIHRMNIICLKGFEGDSNDPNNLDFVEEIN